MKDMIMKLNDLIRKGIALHPAEVRSSDTYGNLPIHNACALANIPANVIEELISAYPESVKQTTTHEFSQLPLHYAVNCCGSSTMTAVVEVLLQNYKEGASVKDTNGLTPLNSHMSACKCPSLDITKMLLDVCPDAVLMCNDYDWYPLHYAAYHGNWEISKYLIDLYPYALMKKDNDGRTPRDIATDNYHYQLCDKLREEEEKQFRHN